jgi:epoxyqueuosine reductase
VGDKIIDANKCLSYNTIERSDDIPESIREKMGNIIFGCDICQDVCPWNKSLQPHSIPDFKTGEQILSKNYVDWNELSTEEFNYLCKKSPLKRAGIQKIKDNIKK